MILKLRDTDLSVIIVTYNSKKYLNELFSSIDEYCPNAQIVVCDNASSDGTVQRIKELCPDAIIIESDVNWGFAKGNNIAVSEATNKYLLLLNADAFLRSSLEPAFELLETEKSIGVIGGKMLGKDLEYRFSAGSYPVRSKLVKFSTLYKYDDGFLEGVHRRKLYDVDWVEGSFLLTRKSLWDSVGGLDEKYFMYVEDVDYCKSVKNVGQRVVYVPEVEYQHVGGYGHGRINLLLSGFLRFNTKFASNWSDIAVAYCLIYTGFFFRLTRCALGILTNKNNQKSEFFSLCKFLSGRK